MKSDEAGVATYEADVDVAESDDDRAVAVVRHSIGAVNGGRRSATAILRAASRGAVEVSPSEARASASVDPVAAGIRPARVYLVVKFAVEWVTTLALLVLTAPLMAVLAALVKLTSPGPAFYLQTRLGLNGKSYLIWKLRTMEHNCEARTGPVWATKDDVRITPIGRLLRETHLDELPQLWNILRGEMALIGPRPERPEIVAKIERELPGYRERLKVRPGVTGLAQMRLPADSDVDGVRLKLAHDLYYIQHLGVMLDLRIAVCTAFHFAAAAAHAVCELALGSYGADVNRQADRRLPDPAKA